MSDILETKTKLNTAPLFAAFYNTVNPGINFGNKTSRLAAEFLIRRFGLEKSLTMAAYAISIQDQPYAPTINTPYMLKEKLATLIKFKLNAERDNAPRKIIKA